MIEILFGVFVLWCFGKFLFGVKDVYGERHIDFRGGLEDQTKDNGNGPAASDFRVTVGMPHMEYTVAVPQRKEKKTPKVYVPKPGDWSMGCGCIYRKEGHTPVRYCIACNAAERSMRAIERMNKGYGPRKSKEA